MNRYIVLREKGAALPLLIDKTTMTVTRLDPASARALDRSGTITGTEQAFSGLEFAKVIEYRTTAPARMFYHEPLAKAG
jgi:hypothetical protein